MLHEAHPPVFDQLLDRAIRDGSRYLELRRADSHIQLHALVGGSWRALSVTEQDASEIWEWAAQRLLGKHPEAALNGQRPTSAELIGDYEDPNSSDASRPRLKVRLRWLSRAAPGSQMSGTIALRLVDAQGSTH
ncbi:hypothetical protein [Natronospira bacteriovora]|uniref:Amphi-Trp domain-containing protein n=1 Tax=Natronospira bacteriovora TaxID=3069753 RepID=A0ABU0W9U8_9GAMM|nr:hypothetical protein [Natronospira sp. AB-CW4]MDQ2070803.1 hypothetical protein [Natronospira sp. AB-CW4]